MTNVISREEAAQLPFKHVSYSGIRKYTSNQQLFFKGYIRHDFNEEKGLAQLVGVACHAAVEEAINTGIYDPNQLFATAQRKFAEEVNSAILNGFNKWRENGKVPGLPIADTIQKMLTDIEILLTDKKELSENYGLSQSEIESIDVEKGLESRFRYVEWLQKEGTIEDAERRMDKGVCNFIDNHDRSSEVIAAEMEIFTFFRDLEGIEMPLPLKSKIDLAILHEDGESIVGKDHKFKERLSSDEDTVFPAYEMQAGFYKIALEAELGREVKRFEFDEIKTDEAKPPRLLQAELNALMDENGIEYDKYMTNTVKTDILLKAGIIKMQPVFKKIIVDFDKKPYILPLCIETYKRFLNQVHVIYSNDIRFLPNLSDVWDNLEGYTDFLEEIVAEYC